ncbi:MAG: hypothetical protein JW969_18095 [Spirochaetales bacterium]|nr:hypothetical protein [Spirochaetales bacterium]
MEKKRKKRKLGKFIFSMILLLAFGVYILIGGWVEFGLPQGVYGVTKCKAGDFNYKLVKSGSFTWRWEKLLPTVMTIYEFNLTPYRAHMENPIKGNLYPSAQTYLSVMNPGIDFSFEIKFYAEFVIIPESLPDIVSQGVLPDNLNNWYETKGDKLGEKITKILIENPTILYDKNYLREVREKLVDDPEFNAIDLIQIEPKTIKLPDAELYNLAKKAYLERKEQELKDSMELLAERKKRDLLAIKKEMEIIQNIDKYAELLEKYPVLIDFLYLRNLSSEDYIKLSTSKYSNLNKNKE